MLRFTLIGMKTKDVVYRGAGETDCCRAGRERYGSRGSYRDRVPEIKKERMTGSVEVVTSKDIVNKGYTSVEDVLKGQMAGWPS